MLVPNSRTGASLVSDSATPVLPGGSIGSGNYLAFNHDNYGTFVTITNNSSFGQSRQDLGNAYVPRSGQIGFRFSF